MTYKFQYDYYRYPSIRLAFAIFQEEQGNIKEARELYQQTMATGNNIYKHI